MKKVALIQNPSNEYRVYFTNFHYFANESFNTFQQALKFAKSKGFETNIYNGSDIIASVSPIGGLKFYSQTEHDKYYAKSNPEKHSIKIEKKYSNSTGRKFAAVTIDGKRVDVVLRGAKPNGENDFGDIFPIEEYRAKLIKDKALEKLNY